ncbi:MAG: uncharacterized protein KVP18_002269 [Porospora cf. gigantea A]|nr:MAG: hypothetical protein KVP18_002269 [Porospora cf. gigantea A]
MKLSSHLAFLSTLWGGRALEALCRSPVVVEIAVVQDFSAPIFNTEVSHGWYDYIGTWTQEVESTLTTAGVDEIRWAMTLFSDKPESSPSRDTAYRFHSAMQPYATFASSLPTQDNTPVAKGGDQVEAGFDAWIYTMADPQIGWTRTATDAEGRTVVRILASGTDTFFKTSDRTPCLDEDIEWPVPEGGNRAFHCARVTQPFDLENLDFSTVDTRDYPSVLQVADALRKYDVQPMAFSLSWSSIAPEGRYTPEQAKTLDAFNERMVNSYWLPHFNSMEVKHPTAIMTDPFYTGVGAAFSNAIVQNINDKTCSLTTTPRPTTTTVTTTTVTTTTSPSTNPPTTGPSTNPPTTGPSTNPPTSTTESASRRWVHPVIIASVVGGVLAAGLAGWGIYSLRGAPSSLEMAEDMEGLGEGRDREARVV